MVFEWISSQWVHHISHCWAKMSFLHSITKFDLCGGRQREVTWI